MAIILQQRLPNLKSLLLAAMSLLKYNWPKSRNRSCRRLPRNTGWWDKVWFTYDDKRFRQTLRVSRKIIEKYRKIISDSFGANLRFCFKNNWNKFMHWVRHMTSMTFVSRFCREHGKTSRARVVLSNLIDSVELN